MKQKLLSMMLLLFALIVGSSAWATDVTYTFTSKSWECDNSDDNWTSGKDGGQLTANQGVQVTTGYTGANATSPVSYSNISKVVVRYCTNASKGAGTIKVQVGSGTEKSFTVSKPSSGGQTLKDATFNYTTPETGKVKLTVDCTTNSIYIYSVTITYSSGPTTYTVTYAGNGNNSGDVPEDDNDYEKNDEVTVLGNTGSLAKTGCAFDGWNTQADGNGIDYAAGATFFISANTTLYAKWNPYTITAVSNNNSYGTVSGTTTITASPAAGYRVMSGTDGYSVTVGTAEVTNNGDNTFTVTPTSDCTVQINFEAIPTHTLSSAVSPVGAGMVTLDATSIMEGYTTNATAAANTGYKFTGWSISGTGASLSSTTDNPTTVTMGTENATVTANFEAIIVYPIHWSVNGTVVKTDYVEENTAITFAAPTSGVPAGYVFKGWVVEANKIDTPTDTDPSANFVTSANSEEEITYYAVMAVSKTSGPVLTKLGSSATFSAGDNIVIVAKGKTYALYQETKNTSYVANYTFDNSAATVNADSKKYLTLSASNEGWYLGDATNGYLYNAGSGNELYVNNNKASWVIAWNDAQSAFTIKCSTRYLSCRTDLTSGNANLYRMGGTGTSTGTAFFDIYKFAPSGETFSNFCTTVPPATITLASACNDGKGNYYGTYSNSSAFVVPEGLTVAAVGVSEDKLVVTPYTTGDIVKANTGVLVSATSAGDKTVVLSAETGTEKDGNLLKASGSGITADDMATAAPDCLYYRLTMHDADPVNEIPGTIGFWYGAENGAAFALAANKAYLAVPSGIAGARMGFAFGDDATGIASMQRDECVMHNEVYNLQGQRVKANQKGIVIVNGKKVVIK